MTWHLAIGAPVVWWIGYMEAKDYSYVVLPQE
jgi:hypothetical protein